MEYLHLNKMIGQNRFKKEISFFLNGYKKTGYMPSTLLSCPRGTGKSLAAKLIAAELKDIESSRGNSKKWLPLNGSDLTSGEILWTKILPIISEAEYLTIFIDECSEINRSVQNIFLSLLNLDENRVATYCKPNGDQICLDYKKLTLIMATTRANLLHPDLRDRLRRVELDIYSENELAKIIQMYSPNVQYCLGTLKEIATTVRCNARKAQARAEEILATGITFFGRKEWTEMKEALSILPLGLSKQEKQYILILLKNGILPLNEISHRLNLESKAVSGDIEGYLKYHGLITTQQRGRVLTEKGVKVAKLMK